MKQSNLSIDTAPVVKSKETWTHRTDGVSFSFKFEAAGIVFKSPKFFGDETAQKAMMRKITDAWPTKLCIEK